MGPDPELALGVGIAVPSPPGPPTSVLSVVADLSCTGQAAGVTSPQHESQDGAPSFGQSVQH